MVKSIRVKTAVSRTKIPVADFTVNPYIGCSIGCKYCFARFIGPFKSHGSEWGKDIFVKENIAECLRKGIDRFPRGVFFVSTVCDAYQHVEKQTMLTRRILEILVSRGFPIFMMTKSSLITRDIDLLQQAKELRVMISITTDRDDVIKALEPGGTGFAERLNTLKTLRDAGIDAGVFVGPVLPMNQQFVAEKIAELTNHVTLDPLNYPWQVKGIFRERGWHYWLTRESFLEVKTVFKKVIPTCTTTHD
ncbi:MAG TPA: radical SAM protein [Kosmotogaceae bacterium]|nr:MAG: Radical SAM domain protein [Thermotogales bacterium 46_20]HAA86566.1 radical SAM protein [Kosmotogaceae bacterium]